MNLQKAPDVPLPHTRSRHGVDEHQPEQRIKSPPTALRDRPHRAQLEERVPVVEKAADSLLIRSNGHHHADEEVSGICVLVVSYTDFVQEGLAPGREGLPQIWHALVLLTEGLGTAPGCSSNRTLGTDLLDRAKDFDDASDLSFVITRAPTDFGHEFVQVARRIAFRAHGARREASTPPRGGVR